MTIVLRSWALAFHVIVWLCKTTVVWSLATNYDAANFLIFYKPALSCSYRFKLDLHQKRNCCCLITILGTAVVSTQWQSG